MSKKYTTQSFIEISNKIHNNFYSYDKTKYINARSIVIVTCPVHGDFEILAKEHINCRARGCQKCSKEKRTKTTTTFIKHAKKIHNNFYSYDKTKYIKDSEFVTITCPVHGDFLQIANNHLSGHGCKKCMYEKNKEKFTKKKERFIQECQEVHFNFYNYSKVEYLGSFTEVKIICPIHGIFKQKPCKHLSGQGCPKCQSSKGENEIEKYLRNHNINFIPQKRFKDCRNKYPLPFDFYLPEYNVCIEYDGEFHYRIPKFCSKKIGLQKLNETKFRDNIKNKFCKDNNIFLLRIPFWQKNDIHKILSTMFNDFHKSNLQRNKYA